jgi:signal transduction histidine kinase
MNPRSTCLTHWFRMPGQDVPSFALRNPQRRSRALPVERRVNRQWLTLPFKTTLILLTLLIGVVTLCGGIFLANARSILQKNKATQVSQLAYTLATTINDDEISNPRSLKEEFAALGKTPSLEFLVVTDASMNEIANFVGNTKIWNDYRENLGTSDRWMSTGVGRVRTVTLAPHVTYVVTVPVFHMDAAGEPGQIQGYLHLGSSADQDEAQLRYLQAFVLLTCMAVVLAAVPIAGFIARHITVPIQKLAAAAHALAAGDLAHRVRITRSDELGELTAAFNRMADTVQHQQLDIRQINAGLEQKVHERTAQLEKLNRRLTAEMAEKEDFLRAVSHDLNAPLRNIAGMASMLILKYRATLEEDAVQRLERIQKNVDVECELINELLELSRIKSRREKIERIDLAALITTVAEGFSSDLETRNITLHTRGQFPIMHGEKSRMRQVFQNLIDNGVKYMREESKRTISIAVESRGDEVVFAVSDTGIGIASEEIPHLFHVFRRAKNASVMKIPGKGVGLASVKSIIENYNGRLWIESTKGEGTVFYFAIPRAHFEFVQEVAA